MIEQEDEKPRRLTIEEYREMMRSMGRMVTKSYDRMCAACGLVPVYKNNKSGVCPDCDYGGGQ